MSSPFARILRDAIRRTPGAVGGAFAARDGEIVDAVIGSDPTEWALLIAHYGVVLGHVQSALRTFHYGDAELLLMSHSRLDILVHAVAEGYYALIAVDHPAPLARAMASIETAAQQLREEMA